MSLAFLLGEAGEGELRLIKEKKRAYHKPGFLSLRLSVSSCLVDRIVGVPQRSDQV